MPSLIQKILGLSRGSSSAPNRSPFKQWPGRDAYQVLPRNINLLRGKGSTLHGAPPGFLRGVLEEVSHLAAIIEIDPENGDGRMAKGFDAAKFKREVRAAQRKVETELKREVARVNRENQREIDRVNRENQRRVDAHNRKVDQHNKRAVADYNRRADAHNRAVIADLNRQLRAASSGPRYTTNEQALADRVHNAVAQRDDRDWDAFLSYARIDGFEIGEALRRHLGDLGVSVWFDAIAITPGKSQALQMDKGLQKARAGIALLTPAYLVGRFWTERELGVLLHKETLIPVLHGVSFDEVAEYSGILPDLAGFETSRDSVEVIAQKIAAAVVAE